MQTVVVQRRCRQRRFVAGHSECQQRGRGEAWVLCLTGAVTDRVATSTQLS